MRRLDVGLIALMVVASPLTVQQQGRAETYMGIGYDYTINDVKAMFPGANFEDQKVAWAKSGERLISITGEGIIGSIRILFQDARPSYSDLYTQNVMAFLNGMAEAAHKRGYQVPPSVQSECEKQAEEVAAKQSDDNAYEAKWVRWIPDNPIPLSRLKARFGERVRFKIDEQDFSPWAVWDSKGVSAPLTDDKKYAQWIEFDYTKAEIIKGTKQSVVRILDAINPKLFPRSQTEKFE